MCALRVSSVCSTESGFKPGERRGAAAAGHRLGRVSLGFLQGTRAGKGVAALLRSLTLRLPGVRGVMLLRRGAQPRTGVAPRASPRLLAASHPVSPAWRRGRIRAAEPLAPSVDARAAGSLCRWWGELCRGSAGTRARPSVWPLAPRSISPLRAGCRGGGRSWGEARGAAL